MPSSPLRTTKLPSLITAICLALAVNHASAADLASCTSVPVQFKIVAGDLAGGQTLHVSGEGAGLGDWQGVAGNTLTRVPGTAMWSVTIALPPSTPIEFSFMKKSTSDEWERSSPSYGGNRAGRTQDCGAPPLVIDGGTYFSEKTDSATVYQPVLASLAGPYGKHIKALLTAINSNNRANVPVFLEGHASSQFIQAKPMGEHQAHFARAYRETGGLDLRAVRQFGPTPVITLILQDRNIGSWFSVPMSFEEGGERRISGMGFGPTPPPSLGKKAVLSEAEMVRQARAIVALGCKSGFFSGSLLIAHGKKPLYEQACGEASKRYHVRNNIDTKFNLGSMNKMFTAVAILQLIEQGRLDLDDDVSKFVDDTWLQKEMTSKIRVRHLLSHTSGLGSYFNEKFWKSSRTLFREVNDFKTLVNEETLAFEPGQRYQYSNTGMLLLGVVIEKVSAQNYFDYIRTHVTGAAGMRHTDSYAIDDPVPNLATGYTRTPAHPDRWTDNTLLHVMRGGPAGGGYSTVRDLHKFVIALHAGKLLKPANVSLLWDDHAKAGYGFGFSVQTEGSAGKVVGHSGGFAGVNGNLDIYLDRGYSVIVLSNTDRGASVVAERIKYLIGQMAR
ncbi:MAG: serine hydrolase [Telluria sp.]